MLLQVVATHAKCPLRQGPLTYIIQLGQRKVKIPSEESFRLHARTKSHFSIILLFWSLGIPKPDRRAATTEDGKGPAVCLMCTPRAGLSDEVEPHTRPSLAAIHAALPQPCTTSPLRFHLPVAKDA